MGCRKLQCAVTMNLWAPSTIQTKGPQMSVGLIVHYEHSSKLVVHLSSLSRHVWEFIPALLFFSYLYLFHTRTSFKSKKASSTLLNTFWENGTKTSFPILQ